MPALLKPLVAFASKFATGIQRSTRFGFRLSYLLSRHGRQFLGLLLFGSVWITPAACVRWRLLWRRVSLSEFPASRLRECHFLLVGRKEEELLPYRIQRLAECARNPKVHRSRTIRWLLLRSCLDALRSGCWGRSQNLRGHRTRALAPHQKSLAQNRRCLPRALRADLPM